MFTFRKALLALPLLLLAPAGAQATTCIGSCGVSGPNGVVTAPPSGNATYQWVSTYGGPDGAGQIGGYGGTNGSSQLSSPFYAAAGATIDFDFNYVTSDGAQFADYGWAQLQGANPVMLFTARTQPVGNIVPGFSLPDVNATLAPASVTITPGAPDWAPLGPAYNNTCYDIGCGYTGWVHSSYTVQTSGTYQLAFGVSNWLDTVWDSGMAFDGLVLNGVVIGNGGSPDSPLLPTEAETEDGGFVFEFTPTAGSYTYIDPALALGYDYRIIEGDNLITSAIFPTLAGDPNGYDVFTLGGLLLGHALGGDPFSFGSGVTGFSLRGIDAGANVIASDSAAFVTGLLFATTEDVKVIQAPNPTTETGAVPEPSTWLMLLAGFGAIGFATRRRRELATA